MSLKIAIVFAAGFGAGWAVRSMADSSQGVGVKLAEVTFRTKKQVSRWAARERERLADILAEGRARAEQVTRSESVKTSDRKTA